MFSTSGVFSRLGDTMSTLGGYHEYIRGCSVHQGDIMMHVEGYHACGGISSIHRSFQYKLKGFSHLAPPHAS